MPDYWLDKYIVFEALQRKYGQPACGRWRASFFGNKYVIKFPLCLTGESDNLYERRLYAMQCGRRKGMPEFGPLEEWGHYARCRIIVVRGISLLVMERLNTRIAIRSMPSWADFIDCRQVGIDRHGKYKAYDYGWH